MCVPVETSAATELFLQSTKSQGAQAKRLFDLACSKYQLAAKVQPDDRGTLVAWGNALFIRARALARTDNKTSGELFEKALEKFRAAAAYNMLFSWANFQHAQALELRGGPSSFARRTALRLFEHAERLFRTGIECLPDAHSTAAATLAILQHQREQGDDASSGAARASASSGAERVETADSALGEREQVAHAEHRGLFGWAAVVFDRAVVQRQRPMAAGALYRRAVRLAPWRYHDDVRRGAAALADEELAVLVQLLMRQENVLTFDSWRDVRLRTPLHALEWERCFGIAPSSVASILECASRVRRLSLSGCDSLTDIDACRAIMAAGDSIEDLDLAGCARLSKPTLTHIVTLCSALHSIDISGYTVLA